MKQFYILFSLFIIITSLLHPQINDITRLPVQNSSQSFKESACLWISENEMMIFYPSATNDTIYSTFSSDRGVNWDSPRFVSSFQSPVQIRIYPDALITNSGRILLTWSVYGTGMQIVFSDDNAESWSQPLNILGVGDPLVSKRCSWLNLSQSNNGKIFLAFTPIGNNVLSAYRESSDNGVTWSEEAKQFTSANFSSINFSVLSLTDSALLTVFNDSNSIYKSYSPDNGISWSNPEMIIDSETNKLEQKVVKNGSGNLTIVFSGYSDQTGIDGDIYYAMSSDLGNTWGNETRFTNYIGNDGYPDISEYNGKSFLSFSTERFNQINQVALAILQETTETYTPPKIYNLEIPLEDINFDDYEFTLKAVIIDDQFVEDVNIFAEDSLFLGKLFDDGQHNDGQANDSVFGNTLPILNDIDPLRYDFKVNKIRLPLQNNGIIADVNITYRFELTINSSDNAANEGIYGENIFLGGPGTLGEYDDIGFLFSGGFFLSGISNGIMFSNAISSSTLVADYLPGVVGSDPDDMKNIFYLINKDDTPFGVSWQRWKDAVSLGAEFYDGDNDGIYNPVDKNWNGTWDENEDMPLLIGDETVWCVYNDSRPKYQRRWSVDAQGIEVRQTIFASSNPELENVIFIRYSILNTGTIAEVVDSVYFGVWEDADVGDADDDLVGCDTLLNSGFYYNSGDDVLYGDNSPSFFTTYLQGPIIETKNPEDSAKFLLGELVGEQFFAGYKNISLSTHTFFRGGDLWLGDPRSATEARYYLTGKDKTGNYVDPCSFDYCEVRGGVNCNEVNPLFWASGDPVSDYGWILAYPVDHRNLCATGPFKLEKNKPQEIIIAYVVGRGTDPLNSITVARENVQRAIQEYQSNFASMTYTAPAATNPVNSYVLYQNYPNPFNPTTKIRYELPQDGKVRIELFDILGQKVRTLVDEFKTADRYEVIVNLSGLASGVYIYRMKINDFVKSKKMVFVK